MKKNLTVTIGISAFHEEKNIANLLQQLCKQKEDGWTLKDIVVICDGSKDRTVSEACSVKDPRIKVWSKKDQQGKVARVQELCTTCNSDILVILDADIRMQDDQVISHLISGFSRAEDVVLVGGNPRPELPNHFFQHAVYETFMVFDQARKHLKKGHNIFGCVGTIMAMKKEYATSLTFPPVINEDDFVYFTCLQRGKRFIHVPEAIVWYKLPSTLSDYLKQKFRSNPNAVRINMSQYFGPLVEKEYYRSPLFYGKSILSRFVKNPLGVSYMIIVQACCIPLFPIISSRYKIDWYTAHTTK